MSAPPLRLGAVLVLTVACLAWVFAGIDMGGARAQLGRMGWGWLLPVELLYLVSHVLRVLRLRLLLGRTIPFGRLMSLTSAGYLAIHVVPLRMGEFVRPYLLQQKEGVPFGEGLAAVFLERLLDMLMLLGMLLAVGLFVELPPVVVQGVDVLRAGQRGAGAVVLVGVLGLGALTAAGERALAWTDRLPVGPVARRFHGGLAQLVARPRAAVVALGLSVAIWTLTVLAVALSLRAFGLPADARAALTVWSLTLAGMTAVPTPGFFGGFEVACVATLLLLGAAETPSRAFAIVLHLGQFVFTVVSGGAALLWEGWSLRALVSDSRAALAPPGRRTG
jgi:uncharacterized membrane protein YbhN (UPF0104 family)